MIDFSLVFAAGFLGSAHCVGMCGGFVLAASAAVHLAGTTVGSAFAGVQDAISIGAGALMLMLGLITALRGTPAMHLLTS